MGISDTLLAIERELAAGPGDPYRRHLRSTRDMAAGLAPANTAGQRHELKRTTGLEPATFGLGSRRSTN
jgi:hypothetical protein